MLNLDIWGFNTQRWIEPFVKGHQRIRAQGKSISLSPAQTQSSSTLSHSPLDFWQWAPYSPWAWEGGSDSKGSPGILKKKKKPSTHRLSKASSFPYSHSGFVPRQMGTAPSRRGRSLSNTGDWGTLPREVRRQGEGNGIIRREIPG